MDAAWDAAVAALKAVLEPAFRGATAAAAMLTVKDFILLVCLALGGTGWKAKFSHNVLVANHLQRPVAMPMFAQVLGAASNR